MKTIKDYEEFMKNSISGSTDQELKEFSSSLAKQIGTTFVSIIQDIEKNEELSNFLKTEFKKLEIKSK